jgi:hypothetical protein
MTGGGGLGGDSFTNFSTNKAGTSSGSTAHDGGQVPAKPLGGVGSIAVLVVAVILVLLFLAAVLLF